MAGGRYRDIKNANLPSSWEFYPITLYCGSSITDNMTSITSRNLINPLPMRAYCEQVLHSSGEGVQQLDGIVDVGIVTHIFYAKWIDINNGLPTPIQSQRRLERKYLTWSKQNRTGTFINIYKILLTSDVNPKYPLYMQLQCKWLGIQQKANIPILEAAIRY